MEEVGGEADILQLQHLTAVIEEAQHHPLAKGGRQGRDADIDILAGDAHAEAAVLGEALLGDIESGYDLDARDDGGMRFVRRPQRFVEDAVDAITDDELGLEGLDMDVARPFFVALGDEAVDKADDRRFVGDVEEIFRFRGAAVILAGGNLFDHLLGPVGAAFEVAIDGAEDFVGGSDDRQNPLGGEDGEIVERTAVVGIGDGDAQSALLLAEGEDAQILEISQAEAVAEIGQRRFRRDRFEERQAALAGQGSGQLQRGNTLLGQKEVTETAPRFSQLLSESGIAGAGGKIAGGNEELAELDPLTHEAELPDSPRLPLSAAPSPHGRTCSFSAHSSFPSSETGSSLPDCSASPAPDRRRCG